MAFVIETLIHLAIYIASALQLLLLLSRYGSYCTQETGVLALEGRWLLAMSISQVIITTTFAVWNCQLGRALRS